MNFQNLFVDRILLLVVGLVCAVFAWAFFNVTGEYATIFFLMALLCSWWDDHRMIKRLRKENIYKSERIKALKVENSTLKKTAAIKQHLIDTQ